MADSPWLMRTYAGHSSAQASNELFHRNVAKGQTGLSIAFDLPTQTGYDPDHPLAAGEVGKVGVPVAHIGDMRTLLAGLDLASMNTSMTINAPAMWMLALYQAVAEEQGVDPTVLRGTTQNDIIKEYLSRGTYMFGPQASMRLTANVIEHTVANMPKFNPINLCSYHLQEAGATAVQEVAFALSTAIAVLDHVRERGNVPAQDFPRVVSRMSFFVNAGVRFIEEMCKMRAFSRLWDELVTQRYGITDERARLFRYGVQVNSLGLTHDQPENNMTRILLEMLAVTLSKDARARAVQLPAWNEALGLPRPWDQQWSLRMQQILAFESDLLEYDDIFAGSEVIETKTTDLMTQIRTEMSAIEQRGGMLAAVADGYAKSALVSSHAAARASIESKERIVVGVNAYTETEPSPLTADAHGSTQHVSENVEEQAASSVRAWRQERDADPSRGGVAKQALEMLRAAALDDAADMFAPTLECARAGVTTGEWGAVLRDVFGEYRGATGVSDHVSGDSSDATKEVRELVRATGLDLGSPLRMLVGKPGLDGHSNGAEQVAVRAKEVGYEVIYQGIRLTADEIVDAALAEDVHVVGLSVLSGSHMTVVPHVLQGLREAGADDVVVVVGGIIGPTDAAALTAQGVHAVYTPADYDLTAMMADITQHVRARRGRSELP